MNSHKPEWTPQSWKAKRVLQQPTYEDHVHLERCLAKIGQFPPLVHSGEILNLRKQLAEAGEGRRFILQAGDCAERFVDCNPKSITEKLKIILQMSLILVYGLRKPVVRIGRIAGQYAKPRSDDAETISGETLPSFRGDIINGFAFHPDARKHDPERLVRAYICAGFTTNWLRALIEGGFADIRHPEMWKLEHINEETQPFLYTELSQSVRESTEFLETIGASSEVLKRVDFFTSHEALLLDYESALTRYDQRNGGWFNQSAHFVWLGERTRQLDGAHAEYLRGIENPIGIKVGPTADPREIIELLKFVNPQNIPGKVTLITRMGAGKAAQCLPPLLQKVKDAGVSVVWSVDPMHGNVIKTQGGIKTRDFDSILAEIKESQAVHKDLGTILGGVHFELTGENVTECIGGGEGLQEEHLGQNYQTYCDPRLNYSQSMEMAYLIAKGIGK